MVDTDNTLCLKLIELSEQTGYPITQHNGQRKFGPPKDWEGSPPQRGCEVFVGKLHREVFEDELVPLFSRVGKIYEMRLMMDFSGSNRGYAFVTYTSRAEASAAVKEINGYEIRPGRRIGVVKSVDNCRLFVGGIPKHVTKEEVLLEMSKYVSGIVDIILYKNCHDRRYNRGFAFVEFITHRAAAMARRSLVPGCVQLWDNPVAVDWAEPEPDVDDDQMKKVKVLYMRNLQIKTTPAKIQEVIENGIQQKVERIKKLYDYAFIHFHKREHAELAMLTLQKVNIDGVEVEIKWAKPVDRDLYRIQKMSKGNAKFNSNSSFAHTLMLYKQHVAKREYANCSPRDDEGISSGCAGDSMCDSPCEKTNFDFQCNPAAQDFSLPVMKLDSLCKRYRWVSPVYENQKIYDAYGVEAWITQVTLPQIAQHNLPNPLPTIGPFYSQPCSTVQAAQANAAQVAINNIKMLQHSEMFGSCTPSPVSSPYSYVQPVPRNVGYPYDYYSQMFPNPTLPITMPAAIWRT